MAIVTNKRKGQKYFFSPCVADEEFKVKIETACHMTEDGVFATTDINQSLKIILTCWILDKQHIHTPLILLSFL